jgi:hypothetical protein
MRSAKEEALSGVSLFGERTLRHALTQYGAHDHQECPHQDMGNVVLMPLPGHRPARPGLIRCRERLGRLLKCYDRDAA